MRVEEGEGRRNPAQTGRAREAEEGTRPRLLPVCGNLLVPYYAGLEFPVEWRSVHEPGMGR